MLKRYACSLVVLLAALGAQAGELATTAEETKPIAVGEMLPEATVQNLEGEAVPLKSLTAEGPVALVFYRGGWCPYCNVHLKELKEALPGLKEAGVRLVALSADKPEKLAETVEKNELDYTLLSDAKLEAAKALGIAFKVDDATVEKYKGYKIDLEEASGEAHHGLPVPSVFLVDKSGKIQFVHSEPDYKQRLENEKLLEAVRGLG